MDDISTYHLLFALTLSLIMELGISYAAVSTPAIIHCRESEQKALVEFKRQLRDPTNRLSSWIGDDCCAWEGVGCNNLTGHVVKLDLRNRQNLSDDSCYDIYREHFGCKQALHGDLSPSLLSLQHLGHLDLSGNYFGHHIPAFLGSLRRLTYLNLSYAGFVGRVPDHIGNLTKLLHLDLSYNSYPGDGGSYKYLYLENSGWISQLSSLRLLNMTWVNFTGASNWLQALNALPRIEEVELVGCHLGAIPSSLPQVNFTSLTTLKLRGNLINTTTPHWLLNLTTLGYLDLAFNYIYWSIPSSSAKLTSLKVLDLSTNILSKDFLRSGAISNLCKLQILYLEEGTTFNDGLSSLQVVFTGCLMFSLEELHLRNNKIVSSLPDWFGNMKKLKYLDLSYNSLYGSLPNSLGNMSSLQYLDLSSNNFNATIGEGLGQLKDLVTLDLSYNSLCDSLPNSLGNMTSLQYLDFSVNNFNGRIGEGIGQLKDLVYLSLSSNSLYGSLPNSLGNMSSLQYLDLSSNNFNDTIGEGIGQLKGVVDLDLGYNSLSLSEANLVNLWSLKHMDISHNTLVLKESHKYWIPPFQLESLYMSFGKIEPNPHFPQWLRTQRSLSDLYLTAVGIKDTIPNWLPSSLEYLYLDNNEIDGDMTQQYFPNLRELSLSNNSLSGHLPTRIANLMPRLEYLDLSNNLFSGHLPPKIFHSMPNLLWIYLSLNNLSGNIPLSFCHNKFLFKIDLSNNSLSGKIPNCWENVSQVFLLDFSNNQLQGGIPNTLCNLPVLQSLHLSHNNLSGEISLSLRRCTSLVTLDLGHNNFTGNIPPWLEDSLPYLKALILRSNAFTGNIPRLSHLASLQILDISNNDLSGSIPRSFGNFSALKSPYKSDSYFKHIKSRMNDNLWLSIKGNNLKYVINLQLLMTTIDLSNNRLSGPIPEELGNLHELQSLNLSRNYLTGKIPEQIGKIRQLETLDLSRNHLSGAIPSSLATLNFLSVLNLSYNNISGRIPTGNQLQTFTGLSTYVGNPYLCGPPLTNNCTEDMAKGNASGEDEDAKSRIASIWVYTSAALGFIVGFWAICGTLLLQRRWRMAYFSAIDNTYDWLYVMVAVNMARIKRELFRRDQDD
ncbi:receptor-like protein 12 [Canna indica]|uniref:Receptor-like protein 12 n=1 Tax=Canna indica TaxID=4628 RepID=A0AAQ3JYV4_9LILI|nr:receptor-like protein 12 [Canna indica]